MRQLLLAVSLAASVACAFGQGCDPHWGDTFANGRLDGAAGIVNDLLDFDDGAGPRLIAGGSFQSAGTAPASNIARSTDAKTWEPMGEGLPGIVYALESFNDGTGLKLYAGGNFSRTGTPTPGTGIRRWNGHSWENIGGPDWSVYDLLVWNDGAGSELYAAGFFTAADGVAVGSLAKWNGLRWADVGHGVTGGYINKMCVYDSPTGQKLVIGGGFVRAGSIGANGIALWDSRQWTTLTAVTQFVEVLAVAQYERSGVRELYFSTMDSFNALRKYNGTTVSTVSLGALGGNMIYTMKQAVEGGSPVLLMGGSFFAGSTSLQNIAKYNGSSFSSVLNGPTSWPVGPVRATAYHQFSGDSQPRLMLGGGFTSFVSNAGPSGLCGPVLSTLPNRANFEPLATTLTVPGVRALATAPLHGAQTVLAGGSFRPLLVNPDMPLYLAYWGGHSWQSLPDMINGTVMAMVRYGDDLIIGGDMTQIFTPLEAVNASYVVRLRNGRLVSMAGNGSPGPGVAAPVRCMTLARENGADVIYAGLNSYSSGLARFDGSSWQPVSGVPSTIAYALTFGDIGAGPSLYGAGSMIPAGQSSSIPVARLTPTGWVSVGTGLRFGLAQAIRIIDLGAGPRLAVAGQIGIQSLEQPSITTYYPVAILEGDRWQGLGSTLFGTGYSLEVLDDGNGPALYVAGDLRKSDGSIGRHFYRWNGHDWEIQGRGLNAPASTMLALPAPDPSNSARLLVGGSFTRSDTIIAYGVADWVGCPRCPADFNQDRTIDQADVAAFFAAWESGDESADVNFDGGIDGADVSVFFAAWNAGGC